LVLEESAEEAAAARQAVLEGRVFWEHMAAGEGTRLGLGPKYLLNPERPGPALTLGDRHLGQWAFELTRLAREAGLDPGEVLARQTLLLVVSRAGRAARADRVLAADFLGLEPDHFLFLEQTAFPALRPEGGWHFEEGTTLRLHNHGHLAMQMTMDNLVFRLDRGGRETRLSREAFFGRLGRSDSLATYSIEDLGYLARALDLGALGLALGLGERGFRMVMELVPNQPDHPVKGAICAHDPSLGRDVMVESLRLRGLPPERITHINKNFNHYPRPAEIFGLLSAQGLFMPASVKDDGLYFQPVRGDMNFLAPTAFFTRRSPEPLSSWKSSADTPAVLAALDHQDAQPGFMEFMKAQWKPR
jgi:hypothetical protein